MFDARAFMTAVAAQDAAVLKDFFADDATINWHDSNESFNVNEYIRANCEYPGDWQADVVRMELSGNTPIFVAKVYDTEGFAVYVTSFVTLDAGSKIVRLDEYFADIGEPPQWRKEMRIGRAVGKD
ncbi:MAG: nuclear transport factor 2 family protein [Defluviitaleaceae bacterium]|nr:nuclear transport factor 2 family protein [Defluviitaleaceae bacterium]